MTISIAPLIKAHAYLAIIEGHVLYTFCMFLTKREG